jgi:hypothetical protein
MRQYAANMSGALLLLKFLLFAVTRTNDDLLCDQNDRRKARTTGHMEREDMWNDQQKARMIGKP